MCTGEYNCIGECVCVLVKCECEYNQGPSAKHLRWASGARGAAL